MSEPRATLVLVHGAWHGSWVWELLTPHLRAQSLAVHCLELPSAASAEPSGLVEDARQLNAALRAIPGPVILCGHSYGGMVISAADTDQADVRHLVYLCAYMADEGESLESSLRAAGERRPGHWIRRLPDGRTRVDGARAAKLFYADCPSATQDWAVKQLRSHWGRALSEPVGTPAWRHRPSTYVVCTQDRALDPRLQREFYSARARRVVTLDSGHSPFLSQPHHLTQVLVSSLQ